MRKKEIDGSYVKRSNARYTSRRIELREPLPGHASLITFLPGNKPFIVPHRGGELCLASDGYYWLNVLPQGQHWCMTAMYNQDREIVQWYIDVTRSNFIDENGVPCLDDFYLDIVLYPDGSRITLDEDELALAVEHGELTPEDARYAYTLYRQILEDQIASVPYMEQLCERVWALFSDTNETSI